MLKKEFLGLVKSSYAKYFPYSLCNAIEYNALGKNIAIDCYLANGKSEWPHGYKENDMFHITFWIHDLPDGEEMPDNITLTSSAHDYTIKPEVNYMWGSSKNVTFRKCSGLPEKCLKNLERYFDKLKKNIIDSMEKEEIHQEYAELIKEKIIR